MSQSGFITLVNLLEASYEETVEILRSNSAMCLLYLYDTGYSDDVDIENLEPTYYISGKGLEIPQLERVEYDSLVLFKLFTGDNFLNNKGWDEILNPLGFQIFENE
jgi:hypothetical protein